MPGWFEGKVALVTGAGSGIGRASALAFAREGARVVVSDVAAEGAQQTVGQIKQLGGEATFIKADVSKTGDVQSLVQAVVQSYGRLDCAHNNAGLLGQPARTADYDEEAWDKIMAVNLKGVWLCMRYEIPQMVEQGGGAIVNTSSSAGIVAFPFLSPYVASKHAVAGLSKAAALEYAKGGIRVNAVCPGFIDTPLVKDLVTGDPAQMRVVPLGRLGTPQEVAEAVVWLCSDAASYVTGHTLLVDGALTVQ